MQWTGWRGHRVPEAIRRALAPAPPAPGDADLLIAVNTDPHGPQETMVHVPTHEMGIGDEPYVVHDLLTGTRYTWQGVRNYVRLDPKLQVGHIFRVEP